MRGGKKERDLREARKCVLLGYARSSRLHHECPSASLLMQNNIWNKFWEFILLRVKNLTAIVKCDLKILMEFFFQILPKK